ncbi:MAG: hypothetical protein ACFFC6_17340 [Promethearchaeota archaeon]
MDPWDWGFNFFHFFKIGAEATLLTFTWTSLLWIPVMVFILTISHPTRDPFIGEEWRETLFLRWGDHGAVIAVFDIYLYLIDIDHLPRAEVKV